MNKRGVLTVISGFSGAGKGTIVKRLVNDYGYKISVSATTRHPRPGERDGIEYFFKTKEEFEQMIADGELIEYAQYVGNYYGTPKKYVLEQLEQGNDVILEIEMQGTMHVKEVLPEASLVFVTPPSFAVLQQRLQDRGTESAEEVANRLNRAKEECSYMPKYDYIVVNDDLDQCVSEMHSLIQSFHYKKENQKELIETITKDFNQSK